MPQLPGFIAASVSSVFITGAVVFLIAGYFLITWDRHQPDSANKADGQVGLKLTLYFLQLVSLGLVASGLISVLHYLLSGARIETSLVKEGAGGIVAGGIALFGITFLFLPRTNTKEFPRAA